jgi:hypothetical protein
MRFNKSRINSQYEIKKDGKIKGLIVLAFYFDIINGSTGFPFITSMVIAAAI